ncbi:MAG: aminodeoxychorismate synthase component I [Ardenticatenales bacterium]|nr:aminodeoxychorismate synthase component I [Ardenticatenales bacterium]
MHLLSDAPLILLDFPADPLGSLLFTNPVEIIVARSVDEVQPALRAVQAGAGRGLYAAGYLAYEAAPAFDPALVVQGNSQMPLLWFGLFEEPQRVQVDALPPGGDFALAPWEPSISQEEYRAGIAAVRAAIARGDTYQVNYTLRLRSHLTGDDFAFYRRLRAAQRAAYGGYLNLGRYRILSASPELFFHWRGDELVTRPMKGTARRGHWAEEDAAQAAWLAASEKNQAENVMIVDLLRNDLSRVARLGSVQVPRLFEIERYPTVFQMTSTVIATARPGLTLEELLAALFPCGSITGAPKVSTMRLIAALEAAPREVYCGAIGLVKPGGEAMFSVTIRTVWLDSETGQAEYGVGGGITWDSTAVDEYEEALAKAALLTTEQPSFELLETLWLGGGRYRLLERHLERVAASAHTFDFPYDENAICLALEQEARDHPKEERRVRLLLAPTGACRVESTPLSSFAYIPLPRVALANEPVSAANRFLYHKTTHRALYETHRAAHPDAFDVLLWNEAREVTEFTIGNLVAEIDGALWTPPLASGLLPGTMRAETLARGWIQERVIRLDELSRATHLWLINSVRGWVEVEVRKVTK